MFNLDKFISEYVIMRPESMFGQDIENNKAKLTEKIEGKSVLVIGGAGSIGSSFIMAILPFKPGTLVVVDVNENALAELTRNIRSTKGLYCPEDFVTYPMDYSSAVFKEMFINREGFDIVANFSAHKHVRSEKDIYSVKALLRNNVTNAAKFLDLLTEYPPEEYFCVSTDKAANPVNIMGASKRLMEDVIFSYSDKFPVKTARFANVAFSNGSLPLGFLERMKKLQPLSGPSDVKRYFVSPQESGQICMLACMLGNNREIFFPKLKEAQMMTFDAIGKKLLEVHGYTALLCDSDSEAIDKAYELFIENGGVEGNTQYPVHFSKSDTSGEKQYEEFFTDTEKVSMDRFGALGVIENISKPEETRVADLLSKLEKNLDDETVTKEAIVKVIAEFLPNFEHIETGKSLDSKM